MQPVNNSFSKSHFGLGRGLDSLIPVIDESRSTVDSEVGVEFIDPNPLQPRTSFDETPLAELASSIREYGIIQPLLVTKSINGRYQLIAGERRLRAAKLANIKTVPVIIRSLDEQKKFELAIIENVQRENLSPIEAALSYKRLMDEFSLSQEDVSRKVGKARSTVANAVRLLTLPAVIKQGLMDGKITEGHARGIMAIDDREAQIAFFYQIINEGLNVRQTEMRTKKSASKVTTEKDIELQAIENTLSEALSTKVSIKNKGIKGNIIIQYYNNEDLERILKKISN
ncbi:MAG: ParB/RepB/Spo0J family partition protein [bacterium]